MQVAIVQIGNSKGIRLPKAILEACHFKNKAELKVEGDKLILEPVKKHPREGWAEDAKEMVRRGDDKIEGWPDYIPTKFDEEEWEW